MGAVVALMWAAVWDLIWRTATWAALVFGGLAAFAGIAALAT